LFTFEAQIPRVNPCVRPWTSVHRPGMPRVPARTVVSVGHGTTTAGRRRRITGYAPRNLGLAGVVTVVLATLMALVAPMPAAAVVPGPNGLVAFVSSRDYHRVSGSDIYVMNADGTNPTRLTTDGSGPPVFSPDGKHIAYQCSRNGNSEICEMNADGSNPVNLTNNPAYDAEPNWGVLAAQQTATTTALDVTPASPVDAGTSETLTATVTPAVTAGSVQFHDGTATLGNPMTVTNGSASMTTALPSGIHPLTAVFTPTNTAAFNSSTSPVATNVVHAPNPTPSPPAPGITDTTTTLQVAPNPGFTLIPEALIAQVAPFNAVGTVQFVDGIAPLGGPVPVFGGFAWLMTPLPAGTHSLTAMFIPH
jgi:Big-like domain-containing protein/WD40 repeat protein